MAEKPSRRFRVGYALAPKKRRSFIQPSLLSLAASRGIDLVPIDPLLDLRLQGPFDLVLHKLPADPLWRSHLLSFSSSHPHVPVIDPPHAIDRLRNRVSMLQVVSQLNPPTSSSPTTFGAPRQVVAHSRDALADPPDPSLPFPLVAKPLLSDGSEKSHKMTLVFTRDALLKLKPPLVLQEFVNHGGVIFKVFVAGNYVKCVKRRSLPDVTEDKLQWTEGSVPFSQVSNVSAVAAEEMQLEDVEMPPMEFLTELAVGLRRALELRLFNFDVIRDVKARNHYLVIDINYFPGYAKMPSYESVLTDFLCDVLHADRDNRNEDGNNGGGEMGDGKIASS